jgi:predicted phage terminase large subunit-like protein
MYDDEFSQDVPNHELGVEDFEDLLVAGSNYDDDLADLDDLDPGFTLKRGEKITQAIDQASFTPVQALVWTDTTSRIRMMVGGIGSGKSYAGCVELLNMPAGTHALVLSPTYVMLKDSFLSLFMHLYGDKGVIKSFNKSDMEMVLKGDRKILFRSAEQPDRLRGSNVGFLVMDEAAFATEEAYQVAIGRVRRQPGRILITTSPNGKGNWVYRLAISGLATVYRAPTASNQFLPGFYREMLAANYSSDPNKLAAELEGEFTDVTGAIFQRKWFTPFSGDLPQRMQICRAWDCAASTTKRADQTVGLLVALVPGSQNMILLDCVAGKWEGDKVDELMLQVANSDREKWGDVTTVIEKEPGSAGKRLIDMQLKLLKGFRVRWFTSGTSKLARAVPVARAAGQGLISYVPAPWNEPLFAEIEQFTGLSGLSSPEHDDHVDALSLAHNCLIGATKEVRAY